MYYVCPEAVGYIGQSKQVFILSKYTLITQRLRVNIDIILKFPKLNHRFCSVTIFYEKSGSFEYGFTWKCNAILDIYAENHSTTLLMLELRN